MPFIELVCKKCGKVSEELVNNTDGNYPDCQDCGGKREQKYDGKCYTCSGGKGGGGDCSGNCSCCGGCH